MPSVQAFDDLDRADQVTFLVFVLEREQEEAERHAGNLGLGGPSKPQKAKASKPTVTEKDVGPNRKRRRGRRKR